MVRYLSSRHNRKNINKIFADRSTLKKIFLVARKNGHDYISQRRINLDDAVIRLVNSDQMEMIYSGISSSLGFVHFLRYMQAYSFVFPNSKMAIYWDKMNKLLREYLNEIPLLEMVLPQNKMNEESFFSLI